MFDFFFEIAPPYAGLFLRGTLTTVEVTVLSMMIGMVIGLALAVGRLSKVRPLRIALNAYVNIFRGVPLIVVILFTYFTLPSIGMNLEAFWAGVAALSASLGAYLSEVFRAAIQSVDAGQHQAALALGLKRRQVFRLVVLPQALVVATPTLGGYFISLLKDCALVSYIGVPELLRAGNEMISATFRTMEVYMLVGMIYLLMSTVAAYVVIFLENALKPAYLRVGKSHQR